MYFFGTFYIIIVLFQSAFNIILRLIFLKTLTLTNFNTAANSNYLFQINSINHQ